MKRIIPLIITALLIFSSCNKRKNQPGYTYFPDMANSRAYETYTPNPVFKNGRTMQEAVEGTISRNAIPYSYTKEERKLAGRELKNPFGPTKENIERGQRMYGIFCIHCHGENGDGKGYLVTSGKYKFHVRSLLTDSVQKVPDGEIYHVITRGYGIMGAHGSQVTPNDRWKIALYIKNELSKNIVKK